MPESVRVANNRCRKCGHRLDGASGLESRFPKAGDLSICINCGTLAIFNERGQLLPPTEEDLAWINQDAQTQAIIKKAQRFIHSTKLEKRG